MGFPICVEEYTKGNDCVCFPPGMTPKYLNATISGVERCPEDPCQDWKLALNGRWLLTQDLEKPCWWAQTIILDALPWTCRYIAAPQSALAVFTPGTDTFGSGFDGACRTSFSNTLVCGPDKCGFNGKGVVTINFAADVLRGASLWPSRVRLTAERIWRYTNTWYEKNIKSSGQTTFRFADDTKNLHLLCKFDPFLKDVEVRGMIVLWSGAVVDIPPGWHLCDGDDGTPDLRNRFVIGAGDTYNPDDAGGSSSHVHTGTTDGHFHYLPLDATITVITEPAMLDASTSITADTFTTNAKNHLPPYYALCYIMKL